MRISELSDRSGVPVPTIKYYLREGLLPKGESTAATQARYDASHIRRLRLIRALSDVGGLPLASVRAILEVVDQPALDPHLLLGSAQWALGPHVTAPADDERWRAARADTDALIERLGWRVNELAPARGMVAQTLASLKVLGLPLRQDSLDTYVSVAHTVAENDLTYLSTELSREELVERSVALTVLSDQLLIALRRLAQEDASARRWSARSDGETV